VTTARPSAHFVKRYSNSLACAQAAANYRWLRRLSSPLRLPELLAVHEVQLDFSFAPGVPAGPADLMALAVHLGDVHGAVYRTELHSAGLDMAHDLGDGNQIPSFTDHRLEAVRRRLTSRAVPGTPMDFTAAREHMTSALNGPAAFYKDANPRNFLITGRPPITVDFDDLTLAPFGYDLAKLIVTLAMTHGHIPVEHIGQALNDYNAATYHHDHNLGPVTAEQLLIWADIHHILTSAYLGRGGYTHSWHELRPELGELRRHLVNDGGVHGREH
jgi:Phosphotransferase enzyme family